MPIRVGVQRLVMRPSLDTDVSLVNARYLIGVVPAEHYARTIDLYYEVDTDQEGQVKAFALLAPGVNGRIPTSVIHLGMVPDLGPIYYRER